MKTIGNIQFCLVILYLFSFIWLSFSAFFSPKERNNSSNDDIDLIKCSRDSSRKVRRFLNEHVFPHLESSPYALPDTCPLNPAHDFYLEQESNKLKDEKGEWRCRYCQKRFRTEFYLDRHLHLKHHDKLLSNRTVCLGDMCPIFGCESYSSFDSIDPQASSFKSISNCASPDSIKRLKFRCSSMLKKCFQGSRSPKDMKLLRFFELNICEKLHCEGNQLLGSIPKEDESNNFIGQLVRVMVLVIALIIIIGYFLFNGMNIPGLKDNTSKNTLNQIQQEILRKNNQSSWISRFFGSKSKRI